MRMCMPHWEKLKEAIKARGIWHLVKSAEGLKSEIAEELRSHAEDRESKVETPDPLFAAHNLILHNVIRVAGLAVMQRNEDGSERCPLCYVLQNCTCGTGPDCPFNAWIDHAADDALKLVAGKRPA